MEPRTAADKQRLRRRSAVIGVLVGIVGVVITQTVGDSYQNNPFCWTHAGAWRLGCAMVILGPWGGLAAVPVIWKFDVDGPSLRRLATFVLAPFLLFAAGFVLLADGCS